MKKVKLYLNHAGYCWANENHALRGGRHVKIKYHALWGLIEHPEKGYVLYDTGYTQRFFEETKNFPNKIYALATKVEIESKDEIVAQLRRKGIEPDDIKHIFISHFHADHVGGLLDFPNARIYTSSTALNYTQQLPKWRAFSRGVLKRLIPPDIEARTTKIDEECAAIEDPIFGVKYDIFNDQSIFAINLPGHAAGQMGLELTTEKRQYLLIADACWLKKSYTELVLPNPIVKLFFDSWKDFIRSLNQVNKYHKANPEAIVVPTHCWETTSALIQEKIDLDAL